MTTYGNSQGLFTTADYLVFSATMIISLAIGVYYAYSSRKQKTTSEYLMAGREMHFLPVALSLLVTYKSSIMVLGFPAEVYVYGMQIVMNLFPHVLANVLSVWIVVPLLYPLKITSAYEYLELRFNSMGVRRLGSVVNIMQDTWYIGIVIYGAATALEAVTQIQFWLAVVVLLLVAVIYTGIGGLKAVIWTDVFQSLVMLIGMCAVLIKGTMDVGGPSTVWRSAQEGGRLNFLNLDMDPRVRHTLWNLSIFGFVRGFDVAFKQSTIQRIGSTSTIGGAKKALLFEGPASVVLCLLGAFEGLVAYAFFVQKECDPLKSKQLSNPNQILPFLVMDMFKSSYGLPGCFVASLCAACLSTVSSCLSSSSALIWTDFVHPLVGDIGEGKATFITKATVFLSGTLACGIALLIPLIDAPIQQIGATILGTFFGPILGVFFLGCYSSRANAKGVIIGGILAFALTSWMSLGRSFAPGLKRTPFLPSASIAKCSTQTTQYNDTELWIATNNGTGHFMESSTRFGGLSTMESEPTGINQMYTLSYTFIPVIGTGLSLLLGYFFSILTGGNKDGYVDPKYLLSVTDTCLFCLPKSVRRALSCCRKCQRQKDSSQPFHKRKAVNPLL